jgi:hypothetical protein
MQFEADIFLIVPFYDRFLEIHACHKLCPSTAFFSLVPHVSLGHLVGQPCRIKIIEPRGENIPSLLPRPKLHNKDGDQLSRRS